MRRTLDEIGWRRALRYAWLEVALALHRALLLAPLRGAWLRLLGARVGTGAVLMEARFTNADRGGLAALRVGAWSYVGRGARFDLADTVTLGEHVTLADEVLVLTHTNVGHADHPLQDAFPSSTGPVTIERGAYLGARAVVLPGVTIGAEAFVAAGAVVTRDVAPGDVVAGVPARRVGDVAARRGQSSV